MRKWIIGLLIFILVIGAAGYYVFQSVVNCKFAGFPPEVKITTIPLDDPLDNREAQVSGMDWYGDYLIILPQFTDFAGERALYAIPKVDLLAYLDDPTRRGLEAITIPINDEQIEPSLPGFEGYEAIAFSGNQVFLTVEASSRGDVRGYLLSGEIAPDLSGIMLDESLPHQIDLPVQVFNSADEAMFVASDAIVTLFEANGAEINPNPVAQAFDLNFNPTGTLTFPNIEYRVTDATRLDENNNFWVTNQFSFGSYWMDPTQDALADTYGEGCTHSRNLAVERLIEMHYDPQTGISLTGEPPVQLRLAGDLRFRNWEAIVRLDDLGFLIATDKYPGTVLAFVPYP